MNTTEKYIYRVYTEKSFSKAAKALFISQPSLSAAVARKESELGFRIFDRSSKPISLTEEGHIYVNMLEEILESEGNMEKRLQKLSNNKHDSLAIGGASSSAYYLMPAICGLFARRYPNVEMTLDIGNFGAASTVAERFTPFQKLDRHELDAYLGYEYEADKYSGLKIYSERLVVAMHRSLVSPALAPYAVTKNELLSGGLPNTKTIPQKALLRHVPFLEFSKNGNTAHYMTALLGEYRTSPYKITNSRHGVVHFYMMCEGLGALLTNDCVVALSGVDNEDVFYFVFDEEQSTRNLYLITKKGRAISQNLQRFIDVSRELLVGSDAVFLNT